MVRPSRPLQKDWLKERKDSPKGGVSKARGLNLKKLSALWLKKEKARHMGVGPSGAEGLLRCPEKRYQ